MQQGLATGMPNLRKKPGIRYIESSNGDIKSTACIRCLPGYEPVPKCDGRIDSKEVEELCVPCQTGFAKETFGSGSCKRCPICMDTQEEKIPCTKTTFRSCKKKCKDGHVPSPDMITCQPCCKCYSNKVVFDPHCPQERACRALLTNRCPRQPVKHPSRGGALKPSPSPLTMMHGSSKYSMPLPSRSGVAVKAVHSLTTELPRANSPSSPRPAPLSSRHRTTRSTKPIQQQTVAVRATKTLESLMKPTLLSTSSRSITRAHSQAPIIDLGKKVEIHNNIKIPPTLPNWVTPVIVTSMLCCLLILIFVFSYYRYQKYRQRKRGHGAYYNTLYTSTPPGARQATPFVGYEEIQSRTGIRCPYPDCGKEIPNMNAKDGISQVRVKIHNVMKRHDSFALKDFVGIFFDEDKEEIILGIQKPSDALNAVLCKRNDMKLGTLVHFFESMGWSPEVGIVHKRHCIQQASDRHGE